MSKRAWTPGPWQVGYVAGAGDPYVSTGEQIVDADYTRGESLTKADAFLIALAPEMAEAILQYEEWVKDRGCQAGENAQRDLFDLAEKLRAISERESG